MNNLSLALLALATLGVGIFIGVRFSSDRSAIRAADIRNLRDTVASLEAALARRGRAAPNPMLALGGLDAPGIPTPAPDAAVPTPPVDAPESFDVTTFESSKDAFASLLVYAQAMLARGPEGHLTLLRTLNDTFFDGPGSKFTQQLVGSEGEAARFLYPVLEFAMDNHVAVAEMLETIYKTAAEEPAKLEGLDDDVLEVFTEGIAYVMPGMVAADRLERLSGYAEAILAQDADTQPEAVQRNRREIEQALRAWQPRLSPEEALAKLRGGEVSPEELGHLLRQVPGERLAELDLDAVIGPMLERNPHQLMGVIQRIRPRGALRNRLDLRVIRSAAAGNASPHFLRYYMTYTDRGDWAQARPFIEAGLHGADKETAGVFVRAALGGDEPDEAWVSWVLETYDLPQDVRTVLGERLK